MGRRTLPTLPGAGYPVRSRLFHVYVVMYLHSIETGSIMGALRCVEQHAQTTSGRMSVVHIYIQLPYLPAYPSHSKPRPGVGPLAVTYISRYEFAPLEGKVSEAKLVSRGKLGFVTRWRRRISSRVGTDEATWRCSREERRRLRDEMVEAFSIRSLAVMRRWGEVSH